MEKNESSNRRRFFNKLVGAAVLGGIASLILGHKVENVKALDGSGAAGQVTFWSDADSITGDNDLYWDSSNKRLGVGTTTPQARLHVIGTQPNILMGHYTNTITSGVLGATISGGGATTEENRVTDSWGTVGGGAGNMAGDDAGTTNDKCYATVGGGRTNAARGYYSTVGGGNNNNANDNYSTVGGGRDNTTSSNYSTVGGGYDNTASGYSSTVSGGYGHDASGYAATVGGGQLNTASGENSAVGGGYTNTASGLHSTVPGGYFNTAAGDFSFAAGRRAKNSNAAHDGVFLFADQNDKDFNSAAANEFAIRCTGGARFVTAIDGSGNPTKTIAMNSSGQLGIGTTSPQAPIHMLYNTPTMVIAEADGSSPCVLQLDSYGSGSSMSGGGFLGRMSRGTKASPTDVAVGDRLGYNIFGGYAGGAFRHTGGFEAVVESGTISGSSLPTGIRFLTTPGGSVSRQERMRIDKDGNVVPPSDGAGSIGTASKRWGLIRGVTVQSGDLVFENGVKATEEGRGLAFLNDEGEKIAVLDSKGNFHIKGKVMEDL